MSNVSQKHYFRLVNEEVVGPKQRLNNPDGFHPMLRQSWNMNDGLRAGLGTYYTVYKSSKGDTLWPYPNPGNAHDHGSPNIGKLALQTENLVLQIDNMPTIENQSRTAQMSPTLHIAQNWQNWNAYATMATTAHDWIKPAAVAGAQNFYNFVASSTSFQAGSPSKHYDSLIGDTSTATPIQDYTSVVYAISGDKAQREAIGTSLAVEPQYNYYVTSTPNYEDVIAAADVAETFLPNLYVMQSEMRNTTDQLLASWHYLALTLNGRVPYMSHDAGSFNEQTVSGTYDMFAKALSGEISTVNNLTTEMDALNANFVVLASDEKVLLADHIADTMTPFLNKIIIPKDPQARTGLQAGKSFFGQLASDPNARDFLDIMQVICINALEQYSPPPSTTADYRVTSKKILSAESTNFVYETTQESYTYLLNLNSSLDAYVDATNPSNQATTAIAQAVAIINAYAAPGTLPTKPPYRFIRDYARCMGPPAAAATAGGNEGYYGGTESQIETYPSSVQHAYSFVMAKLPEYLRTYLEILNGTPCHTETLMYVVSKHEVNEDDSDGPLLQRFYLTNHFQQEYVEQPITFYDAQVKYEKKYRYKIQKMVAIFGNAYEYEAPEPFPGANAPVVIPVSNDGNVKVVLMPYTYGFTPEENGLSSIIVDSPPVPPEMSFLAHKGVSNKLRLLLNSNTGIYDMPPVAIQDTDPAFFEVEYQSQQGMNLSFSEIKEQGKTIHFKSDDPVDRYQLFRTTTPPTSYDSFNGQEVFSSDLDPTYGTPASYIDDIEPNVKYYYCARSVDVHNNISNPTPIVEVEMIDNAGQIFLRQKPFVFETVKQRLTISGRKYILIEPSARQTEYRAEAQPIEATINDTPSVPLGETDIADSVWNKNFKVRLVSKKTGRKMDLNLNFKNSGIVKGSE